LPELRPNRLPPPTWYTTLRCILSTKSACSILSTQSLTRSMISRMSLPLMLSKILITLELVSMSRCVWNHQHSFLQVLVSTKIRLLEVLTGRLTRPSLSISKQSTMTHVNGESPLFTTQIGSTQTVNGTKDLMVASEVHLHLLLSLVASVFAWENLWLIWHRSLPSLFYSVLSTFNSLTLKPSQRKSLNTRLLLIKYLSISSNLSTEEKFEISIYLLHLIKKINLNN